MPTVAPNSAPTMRPPAKGAQFAPAGLNDDVLRDAAAACCGPAVISTSHAAATAGSANHASPRRGEPSGVSSVTRSGSTQAITSVGNMTSSSSNPTSALPGIPLSTTDVPKPCPAPLM